MSVVAHTYTKFNESAIDKLLNIGGGSPDTLKVLLMASYTPAVNTHKFVVDVTGAGTEVTTSGTGYTRQSLSSVSVASASNVTTLSVGTNPSWTSATFSAAYAVFYDSSPGSDATDPLICYWDFGGTQSVTSGTFTLTISGSGLITITGTG